MRIAILSYKDRASHKKDEEPQYTTETRLEVAVQPLSRMLLRTISLATIILFLLTLVSSACSAGASPMKRSAPDLGTASAGRCGHGDGRLHRRI